MSAGDFSASRRGTLALMAGAALIPSLAWGGESAPTQEMSLGRDQGFNLGWRFFKGEGAFEAAAFADESWRTVDLPHDWSIEDLPNPAPPRRVGPFDATAEGTTATGYTLGGEGWYRKRFRVGALPEGARTEIAFDGVYMQSEVWLNGHKLGEHMHGYTPFAYDLTPHLLRNADNVIAVRVRNLGRNSRWYSGSGLYRPVRLDVIGQTARIARWGVAAWTRRINNGRADIEVNTTLVDVGAGLRLRTRLMGADGVVAAEAISSARAETEQTLRVRDPHLWSPQSPTLYTLHSELLRDESVIDSLSQPFGLRIVAFDAERGMTINGEHVRLRGGCVHHDNGLLGAAAFADADERRVLKLKGRGFNAIRSSHYPCSRSFREACDKHGMLLIEEAFDMWHQAKEPEDYSNFFREHWRADLEAMVLSARNSPSVIMWSIGNEIPGRTSPEGMEIAWNLANTARTIDPTRPVTAAINGFLGRVVSVGPRAARRGQGRKPAEAAVIFLDVPGYNYRLSSIEHDHEVHPERVLYGSETFARDAYDYETLGARAPYMLGEFLWTAMDYLGEAGIGSATRMRSANGAGSSMAAPMMPTSYPWVVANCGDVDLIGDQKPPSLYRDVVWGLSPVEMCVQRPLAENEAEIASFWGWSDELPSWTWPVSEGRPLNVRVYTMGDRVDLMLNGALLESKTLAAENKARVEFNTPYRAGRLEAVAYRAGAEIGRTQIETVSAPNRLRINAEQATASRERDRLSYVTVEVLDAEGRLAPNAIVPVRGDVEGPAELVAFGSANPHAVGSFQSRDARTFRGKALAILRSTGAAGAVRVRVSSAGLASATTAIEIA